MAEPAVKLAGLASGHTQLDYDDNDFVAIVPVAEPISVGVPPIAPDLVRRVVLGEQIRYLRCASGHTITSPVWTPGSVRSQWVVRWQAVTPSQESQLRDFLFAQLDQTRHAFTLKPDGPDGATVFVRAVGEIECVANEWSPSQQGDVRNYSIQAEEVL